MLFKPFPVFGAVLAASSMVVAQTFTECNPLEKDCPADPAMGKNNGDCDFTKGACDVFTVMDGTPVTYDSRGAVFKMAKQGQAPTLRSNEYIFFGRVEVEVQAAPGKGIITSLVLLSDNLDEIDYETVGSNNEQIQSNYFYKGDVSKYDRGASHKVNNAMSSMHTYAFDWTPDKIDWFIDGRLERTLKRTDVGENFPQSPMRVKLGSWVAGYEGNTDGAITWAGGIADFSGGPSTAIYKSVKITDYAGGHSATKKDVKEYSYGDRSGSAKSIQIRLKDGSVNNAADSSKPVNTAEVSHSEATSATSMASGSVKVSISSTGASTLVSTQTTASSANITRSSANTTQSSYTTSLSTATSSVASLPAASAAAATSVGVPSAASSNSTAMNSTVFAALFALLVTATMFTVTP
ncbi:transglycosylase [Conoideocrella luteorostrata]|uniref:Crh-like protein n=1 Tax=Conoideocrella luteorostrata TaxID=1105319 RepID=A0AAJ0FSI2_9HYPO|nr:transglycosylase [Conoideocrella luteorostrata]